MDIWSTAILLRGDVPDLGSVLIESELLYVYKIKNTMNAKMRFNFIDDSDLSTISKKMELYQVQVQVNSNPRYFHVWWSIYKSSKIWNRIFNPYLWQSKYDLDFDCSDNSFTDLYFETDELYHILRTNLTSCRNLTPSKKAEPDRIHDKVLKHCARGLY